MKEKFFKNSRTLKEDHQKNQKIIYAMCIIIMVLGVTLAFSKCDSCMLSTLIVSSFVVAGVLLISNNQRVIMLEVRKKR